MVTLKQLTTHNRTQAMPEIEAFVLLRGLGGLMICRAI
jgi:hypothetical protein